MPVNRGVAPPDMASDVGKFRALVGDLEYETLDPPEAGYGSYKLFSDDEINVYLEQSEGSLEGAVYLSYLYLASAAALESRSVRDLDLQVDLTKRSGDLRAIAAMWKDRWDEAVGAGDIFEVFDTGVGSGCGCVPEASPRPCCRKGCYGGQLF